MANTTKRYDRIVSVCRPKPSGLLTQTFMSSAPAGFAAFEWRVIRTAIRQVLTERGEFPFTGARDVERMNPTAERKVA